MVNVKFDAAIVLGGGRYDEETLTPLSIMRLDKSLELYKARVVPVIIVLGGRYSTYSPQAIEFKKSGARLRKEYLVRTGNIPEENIIAVEAGGDTILEAFAAREMARQLRMRNFVLVTSEKHMARAIFVFRRIFGNRFNIVGGAFGTVETGDILLSEEEEDYFEATERFFANLPEELPSPGSRDEWLSVNKDLYDTFEAIHDKYHPPGHESQAYAGVKD